MFDEFGAPPPQSDTGCDEIARQLVSGVSSKA